MDQIVKDYSNVTPMVREEDDDGVDVDDDVRIGSLWPFMFINFPKIASKDDVELITPTPQMLQDVRLLLLKSDAEGYVCGICGVDIHNITPALNHMKVMHCVKRPYICRHCDRKFGTHCALYHHVKIHSKKGTSKSIRIEDFLDANIGYEIAEDSKQIIFKTNLNDFQCLLCARTLKKALPLLAHLKKDHHVANPYPCPPCNLVFPVKLSLYNHLVANHSNVSRVQCELCKKTFNYIAALKDHMIGHTGDKTFFCGQCSKSFSRKRDLFRHIRTLHNKEWNHVCPICGKLFSQAYNLKVHNAGVHKKIKPNKARF